MGISAGSKSAAVGLVIACAVSSAHAQTYTVPGDFDDLQTALDSVPAESTILLLMDSGPVTIRQGVTIVGDGACQIYADVDHSTWDPVGACPVDAADSRVVFANLSINSTMIHSNQFEAVFPALDIIAAKAVLLDGCTLP